MSDHLVVRGTTITWNLEPGQIVLRFPVDTFDRYADITGVSIPPGVVAHIIDDGEEETVTEGVYTLGGTKGKGKKSGKKSTRSGSSGGSSGLLQRLFQRKKKPRVAPPKEVAKDAGKPTKRAPGVSGPDVVLAWTGPFRAGVSLSDVEMGPATYTIDVGVQLRVSDVTQLSRLLPAGQEIYRSGDIGHWIAPQVEGILRQSIRSRSYDQLRAPDISEVLDRELGGLGEHVAPLGLESLGIVSVRVVDKKQEQLVERDRTLDHREEDLQRTVRENGFLNTLSQEENRRTLDHARTEAALDKALAEIDDQKLLT